MQCLFRIQNLNLTLPFQDRNTISNTRKLMGAIYSKLDEYAIYGIYGHMRALAVYKRRQRVFSIT